MDRTIELRMDASGAPGFAVAVAAEGRVVHARGFGSSDGSGRRITPQTPFLLGSTTNSFTALAVVQLVDAGKVALDAPVRRYLPEFRLAANAADRVTVRHVLQHTSGLPATTSGPILKSAGDGTPSRPSPSCGVRRSFLSPAARWSTSTPTTCLPVLSWSERPASRTAATSSATSSRPWK